MKGEIVWVVIEESAVDGLHDMYVHVFDEKEDAIEHFEKRKTEWKAGVSGKWNECDSNYSWEAWHDGYYDSDHVTLSIEKQQVI